MTTPPAAAPAHAHAAGQRLGIVFVAVSALAFGAMAIMARAAFASGVDAPTLLALRFAIATACMLAIVRARAMPLPRGADLARLSALGALGYGGQAFTFFTALTLAPAGLTALLLYLHPAIVALLAALFLHERITLAKLGALALALAGMVLTVAPALGGDGAGQYPRLAAGVAFGIAAAVIYAVYIVAGTRITARVAPLAMSSVVIASAGAVFVLAALIRGPQWPQTGAGWLAIAGIALLSTVAAISLFFAGLARVGPTRASTLSTIEPLFTVVLAASLLGERILPAQIAGGALILGAVLILARASSTKEP